MLARLERRRRKVIAMGKDGESGMSERKIADGRCVKTIVWMRPIRRESGAARSEEMAERKAARENRVPSVEGVR